MKRLVLLIFLFVLVSNAFNNSSFAEKIPALNEEYAVTVADESSNTLDISVSDDEFEEDITTNDLSVDDPYVALRDEIDPYRAVQSAYTQNRIKKINE